MKILLSTLPNYKFHTVEGSLEKLNSLLVWFPFNTNTIHRQELVTTLEPTMPVSHPTRDDPGDVDGGVLLFASHNIKP